jgi:superfamily I DNA/RNA helicase
LDHGRALPVVLADRPALVAEVLDAESSRQAAPSVGQLEVEIGWAKARLVTPDRYAEAAQDAGRRPALGIARMAAAYERYETLRRRRGVLDLDDLLVSAADILESDGTFRAAVRWRHRHLHVDEMQDVNPAQFRLLLALAGDDPDLCVVGDPHQSVYGWNGADPTLLDRFPSLLPGVRVLRLDENHRCTPQVVAVAGAVLVASGVGSGTPVSTRSDGSVPQITSHLTDADEASWVSASIRRGRRPGMRWSRTGVLARTNAQLGAVETALRSAGIPCRRAAGDLGPASDLSATDERVRIVEDTEADVDTDAVVLSTFHRAKGLQWSSVYVVGLSDGSIPIRHARTPEARGEEARLLYVALTRAEDDLSCSWAEFPDRVALERGVAPRDPSPWLRAVEDACVSLSAGVVAPSPGALSARIAELRSRL